LTVAAAKVLGTMLTADPPTQPLVVADHGARDIETGGAVQVESIVEEDPRKKSCICPCDCLSCCPINVVMCIPNSLHKFQNWTHAILVVGSLACATLLVSSLINVINRISSKKLSNFTTIDFLMDVLVLLFLLPCLMYFAKAIAQYDDDLRKKKKEAQIERRRLVASYEDTLRDMNGLLKDTTEKSAGFAEKDFETHRYDFIRFLKHVKEQQQRHPLQSSMLPHMKQFCLNWFRVFQECSIDPLGHPKILVNEADFEKCITLDELYIYCMYRLELSDSEVKFISHRLQVDEKDIDDCRVALSSASPVGELLEKQSEQEARGVKVTHWALAVDAAHGSHCMSQMSWLTFGCGRAYPIQASISGDGWPKVFRFGCGCMVLLSFEHVMLICGTWINPVLLIIESIQAATNPDAFSPSITAMLAVLEICLWFTLVRFESIDIIQRLERETRKLKEQEVVVRGEQEKMEKFWASVQNLTDLWLYRTIPCLDLLHEIQNHVEDMDSRDSVLYITGVNSKFNALFDRLGPLQDWCIDGDVSETQKKQFGLTLAAGVEKMSDLGAVQLQLDMCLDRADQILPKDLGGLASFLAGAQAAPAAEVPAAAHTTPPQLLPEHSLDSFLGGAKAAPAPAIATDAAMVVPPAEAATQQQVAEQLLPEHSLDSFLGGAKAKAEQAAPAAEEAAELDADHNDHTVKFLPVELNGTCVLVEESRDMWRVMNSINAGTPGLAYRTSKHFEDKHGGLAMWGDLISGVDDGDGWIRCEQIKFLPLELNGVRVLVEESANRWRVTNSIEADTPGLSYRTSRHIEDKHGGLATWGTLISGADDGDGWMQCAPQAQ